MWGIMLGEPSRVYSCEAICISRCLSPLDEWSIASSEPGNMGLRLRQSDRRAISGVFRSFDPATD